MTFHQRTIKISLAAPRLITLEMAICHSGAKDIALVFTCYDIKMAQKSMVDSLKSSLSSLE